MKTDRQALELLSGCWDGVTSDMMELHGFGEEVMTHLVARGFVRWKLEEYSVPRTAIIRYFISDEGKALLGREVLS